MTAVRIAIVDDHPTLLRGIAALVSEDERYEMAGTGSSAAEAVELAIRAGPAVMLLDLSMPGDVFEAINAILALPDAAKIVVFTAFADTGLAIRALDAGVHAYVLKGTSSGELFQAIGAAVAGETYVSPALESKLAARRQLGAG